MSKNVIELNGKKYKQVVSSDLEELDKCIILREIKQPSFEDEYEKVREFIKRRAGMLFKGWAKQLWLNDEQAHNEMMIYLSMKYWKSLYDNEFEPVFKGYNQKKFYLEQFNGKWEVNEAWEMKHNMQVYVLSREKANQMFKDLKSVGVIE